MQDVQCWCCDICTACHCILLNCLCWELFGIGSNSNSFRPSKGAIEDFLFLLCPAMRCNFWWVNCSFFVWWVDQVLQMAVPAPPLKMAQAMDCSKPGMIPNTESCSRTKNEKKLYVQNWTRLLWRTKNYLSITAAAFVTDGPNCVITSINSDKWQ